MNIDYSDIWKRVREIRAWKKVCDVFSTAKRLCPVDFGTKPIPVRFSAKERVALLYRYQDEIRQEIEFLRSYGWIDNPWVPWLKVSHIIDPVVWRCRVLSLEDLLLAISAMGRGRQRYKRMRLPSIMKASTPQAFPRWGSEFRYGSGTRTLDITPQIYEAWMRDQLPEVIKASDRIRTRLEEVRHLCAYEEIFEELDWCRLP